MKKITQLFYKCFDWRRCKRKFDPGRFAGAGNVNWWGQSDPRKETLKLVRAGVQCYHIEVFGWGESTGYNNVDDIIIALRNVIFWCKRRKVALFLSVVNDNAHIAKYGNKPTDLNKYRGGITKVLHVLRREYWSEMFVQPTGETQTSAGRAIEAEAAQILPKSCLVSNSNGGIPRGIPAWASFAAVHMPHVSDSAPSWAWEVTDHGTRIREHGGIDAQDYNDDVLARDAHNAFKRGNPYILYMFQQRKMSASDLAAIARGYK